MPTLGYGALGPVTNDVRRCCDRSVKVGSIDPIKKLLLANRGRIRNSHLIEYKPHRLSGRSTDSSIPKQQTQPAPGPECKKLPYSCASRIRRARPPARVQIGAHEARGRLLLLLLRVLGGGGVCSGRLREERLRLESVAVSVLVAPVQATSLPFAEVLGLEGRQLLGRGRHDVVRRRDVRVLLQPGCRSVEILARALCAT
jgi:hypothetical protein